MKISRREFIKTGTAAAAGITLLGQAGCTPKPVATIKNWVVAAQLYSVRYEMKADPLGSLTQLVKMGYTHVEHANYVDHKFYGWTAAEFKKVLNDLGLNMPSGHTAMGKNHWDEATGSFTDAWKKTVEDAALLGQQYVISPWLDESLYKTYDDLLKFMDVFNKCGELCQKSGLKFGYHNHDFEFSTMLNGEKVFDLMMKNTDPDKVVMQLDMGNMYIAGALAKDVIGQYPGRFSNIHIKDMIKGEGGPGGFESTILGKGLVGSKEVTDLAKASGTTLFVIEQESYQGKTSMECMSENLKAIKSWGY